MKKFFKQCTALLLLFCLCFGLTACGGQSDAQQASSNQQQQTEQTADGSQAILVVSFGTSYNETRAKTIEAVEKAITDAYPDFEVRRAFTSQTIIDKLKERDGLEIDNVPEAMDRLIADGVQTVVVQPTHVMNGYEYDEMCEAIQPYEDKFTQLVYGKPLLADETDYETMVQILAADTADYAADDTAIIFMGHGTEHPANDTYQKLAECFQSQSYDHYLVGTVEATPNLEDIMAQADALQVQKVVLLPLMIVAGDHATNDMAGDEEDSWKTQFKGQGYEVECVLKGLGEYPGIQQMFVDHTADAIAQLQ